MQIEEFTLERVQSLYENLVDVNLSDSGVHPLSLRELLEPDEQAAVLDLELGYGWTSGAVELREAIANLYDGRNADQVMVMNGSAEANFVMVTSLVEPGDDVIVVVPNYMQAAGWARAIGANVHTVAMREGNDGWWLDVDEVEAAINARTRLVTFCTPNNPTGAVLDNDTLEALARLGEKHGVQMHADEVYKGSEFGAPESRSLADFSDLAIVTNGVSKAMALPGLRIGWLVGPAQRMANAWAVKDYTSITTSAVSEYVASRILESTRRERILARSRRLLSTNLATLTAWLAEQPHLDMVAPRAGGMAFLRYDLAISSTELAERLRLEDSLLVLAGDVFGMDGYLRLGTGGTDASLRDGLGRLGSRLARVAADQA